jgi:hypothetical protein
VKEEGAGIVSSLGLTSFCRDVALLSTRWFGKNPMCRKTAQGCIEGKKSILRQQMIGKNYES